MKITLIDKNENGLNTIIQALSLCKDKKCTEKTITYCLNEEHMSLLEECWFSFLVEGLSIKSRIQILRHRMFSTMERSTRFINMSNAQFIIPATVHNKGFFANAYNEILEKYNKAIMQGEKEEDAAYLLPLGIETKFVISGNGRVFFEYLQKRMCKKHVQDETYRMAVLIYNQLNKLYPILFNESYIGCKSCGKCGGNK